MRDIFSNTPNTFGPNGKKKVCWMLLPDSWASLWSPWCLKCPSIALNEILTFLPLVALSQILPSQCYEHSFHSFFTCVNGANRKAWIWWLSSGKLSCKSFQEFYAPFLLNSFLEHVPILHICSFFSSQFWCQDSLSLFLGNLVHAFPWEGHSPLYWAPDHLNKLFKYYNMDRKLDFTW